MFRLIARIPHPRLQAGAGAWATVGAWGWDAVRRRKEEKVQMFLAPRLSLSPAVLCPWDETLPFPEMTWGSDSLLGTSGPSHTLAPPAWRLVLCKAM